MNDDEIRSDLQTMGKAMKDSLIANSIMMTTLLSLLVEKGVITEEEFNDRFVKVQPIMDQGIEQAVDGLANENSTLKDVVDHFKRL